VKIVWVLENWCSIILFPSLSPGDQPGADLGPLISPEAKQRVHDLAQSGVDKGATVSPTMTVLC